MGAGLPPQLHGGASLGLFLLRMSQTFPFDWAAPGEIGCPQIGAAGLMEAEGAGGQGLERGLPRWALCQAPCRIVLSWPMPGGGEMTGTQTHLEPERVEGWPRHLHSTPCLHHGVTVPRGH